MLIPMPVANLRGDARFVADLPGREALVGMDEAHKTAHMGEKLKGGWYPEWCCVGASRDFRSVVRRLFGGLV